MVGINGRLPNQNLLGVKGSTQNKTAVTEQKSKDVEQVTIQNNEGQKTGAPNTEKIVPSDELTLAYQGIEIKKPGAKNEPDVAKAKLIKCKDFDECFNRFGANISKYEVGDQFYYYDDNINEYVTWTVVLSKDGKKGIDCTNVSKEEPKPKIE